MTWQTWTRPVAGLTVALTLTLGSVAPAAAQGDAETIIRDRAASHGVSGDRLVLVARCESSLNRWAVGRAGEIGGFQLHPRGELRTFYARGYTDPNDWFESADFTAARFAEGGARAWSCAR